MSWYAQQFPHDLCQRPEWRYCFGLLTCGWARMLGSQFCIPCPCDKSPLCMMHHYIILYIRICVTYANSIQLVHLDYLDCFSLVKYGLCSLCSLVCIQSYKAFFSLIDKINHFHFRMHLPVICNVEPSQPGLWWQSFSGRFDETLSGGMALTCQQAWWHHQQGLEFGRSEFWNMCFFSEIHLWYNGISV